MSGSVLTRCFLAAVTVLAGSFSVGVSAGPPDLGTDRHVTAHRSDGSISALWGMTIVEIADLNGDGRDDLLTARPGSWDVVYVYLARERDTDFVEAGRLEYAEAAMLGQSVCSADLDGDGSLDVVCFTWTDPADVLVFRGVGDGSFEAARRFVVGLPQVSGFLSFVDVERDGDLDVIVTADGTWLLRNIDGRELGRAVPVGDPGRYLPPAVGDFNGDGFDDLVRLLNLVPVGSGEILLGDGRGGFETAVPFDLGTPMSWQTTAIEPFDLDVDGRLDLLRMTSQGVAIYRGDGSGGFVHVRQFPMQYLQAVVPADLDLDGRPDLLVHRAHQAQVYFGNGAGRHRPRFDAVDARAGSVRIADLDGDGFPDLVSKLTATFQRGSGHGRFLSEPARVTSTPRSEFLRFPVLADLDEDGALDAIGIVDRVPAGVSLAVSRGMGSGAFEAQVRVVDLGGADDVVAADMDGDGHSDIAVLEFSRVKIAYGDGNGNLADPVEVLVAPRRALGFQVVDIDVDGFPDVVVDHQGGVSIFRRQSRDAYVRTEDLPGTGPAVLDFNGDGWLDLVRPRPSAGQLAVHLGRADGSISQTVSQFVSVDFSPGPDVFVALDIDGDARGDLAIGHADSLGISVRLGATGDVLHVPSSIVFQHPRLAVCTELNGSRGDDLILALDGYLDRVEVLSWDRRSSGPRLDSYPAPLYSTGGIAAGDVDGDSHADIVVSGANYLRTFHNRSFDRFECRSGNVIAATGVDPLPVLRVNGSAGNGRERSLVIGLDEPLMIHMNAPPAAAGHAPFALYLWQGSPDATTPVLLPHGIGLTCMPIPWARASRKPVAIWNNLGKERRLGRATKASIPAPSVVVDRVVAGPIGANLFLQGVVVDPASSSGRVAITNAISLRIR